MAVATSTLRRDRGAGLISTSSRPAGQILLALGTPNVIHDTTRLAWVLCRATDLIKPFIGRMW